MEQDNNNEDMALIDEIRKNIDIAYNATSTIYQRCKEDLEFANGTQGSQFSAVDRSVRGEDRAEFQLAILDKYIEQILGNYNASPYEIKYESYSPEFDAQCEMINHTVKEIQNRSKANDVFRTALRSSASTGYGWWHITSDYADPASEDLNVEIRIEPITDYSSVLYDPLSKAIDGSDSRFAAHIDYMDIKAAKAMYGDDVVMYQHDGGMFESTISKGNLDDNDCQIPIVTYYQKVVQKKVKYIDGNGSYDEQVQGAQSKEITKSFIRCVKLLGNKVIFTQDYKDLTFIPIVPCYGMPIYENGRESYVGIVHRAKDAQRLLNYVTSLGAERLAFSAKPEFLLPERALGNHGNLWATAHKNNAPALIYKDFDEQSGTNIASPQKIDTSVNLSDILSGQNQYIGIVSSIIGIPDIGLTQGLSGRVETAEATLMKEKTKETILSTLYENLASSIEHSGRIILEMIKVFYDVDREVAVKNDSGKYEPVMIPFSQMNLIPNKYEVNCTSGPLLSTQRKENLRSLLALAQLMGENSTLIMPEIVKNIDLGESSNEVIQKINLLGQMQMQQRVMQIQNEQSQTAQMQQQLQEMTAQLGQLQQILQATQIENQRLQASLVAEKSSLTKDQLRTQADLLKAQIQAENRLDVERLKIQGSLTEEDIKASNDVDKMLLEKQLEYEEEIRRKQEELSNLITQYDMRIPRIS